MYPKIENLKNLIPEAHPTHHPSTRAYHEYWKEQKGDALRGTGSGTVKILLTIQNKDTGGQCPPCIFMVVWL